MRELLIHLTFAAVTFTIGIIVAFAFRTPCKHDSERVAERAVFVSAQTEKKSAEAVRKFNACIRSTRPATLDCSSDFVQDVFDFYNRGDQSVLEPLLTAGLSSDGALSQELGVFYSEVLSKSPRRFLSAIASRPVKDQRQLCWMAGATDGGGLPKDVYRVVRRSLNAIVNQGKEPLAPIGKVCLDEIKEENASDKR